LFLRWLFLPAVAVVDSLSYSVLRPHGADIQINPWEENVRFRGLFAVLQRVAMAVAVLKLLISAASPIASAQSDATLRGSVKDSTGAAIPRAIVTIRSTETGVQRSITTDAVGRFDAPSLAIGRYELTAAKTGFQVSESTGVTLVVGQRMEVSLTLQIGDLHQVVEVPANLGLVAVTTDDVSGLVGEHEVKELPLNGRSYDELLTLNAGVVNYTSQRAGGIGTW
jgi:Carboxypeptidase regulatory-like domain